LYDTGKGIIKYPPSVIAAAIVDQEKRGEWDQMYKEGKTIIEYSMYQLFI
jgi:hypothetical protein